MTNVKQYWCSSVVFIILIAISLSLIIQSGKCEVHDTISLIIKFNYTTFELAQLPNGFEQILLNKIPTGKERAMSNIKQILNDFYISGMDREYRLPPGLIPEHYVVHIRPILHSDSENGDLEDTAPGTVIIFVRCMRTMNTVTFHSNEITINQTSIKIQNEGDGTIQDISEYSENSINQIVELKLQPGHELKAGANYTIYIEFTSKIHETHLGLFHRKYMTPSGEKKVVLTRLESMGARMVFPCFDEPALKATYQINIAHTEEYNTLCNMEIEQSFPDPNLTNWTWDKYHQTDKMSTYLIAFVVSDFTKVHASLGIYEKPVSTWAAPHYITNGGGKFSADETASILKYFEELFNLKYPLPKMYSVAIPEFPYGGAMEQWGLITYLDESLLYFPGVSTEADRLRISQLIVHELAHQWFGNIVTMEWWSDLWLKEGFASYIEKAGIVQMHPEFDADLYDVSNARIAAMAADARATTLPVHYNGHFFNRIVYDKARFLIRMMEAFLTKVTFQKGVNTYLKAHLYGTAKQDDLFNELTRAGHEDKTLNETITVKSIMDTWTRQTGFPLVRVGRITNEKVYVSQERFGKTPPTIDIQVLNKNEFWTLPLSFATTGNPDFTPNNQKPKAWLEKSATLGTFSLITKESDWIILNVDATGTIKVQSTKTEYALPLYRVIYDTHLTKTLKAQLDADSKIFSPATRSQILDDHFECAFEKYITIDTAMDFTTFLNQEETLAVWETFFSNFHDVLILLDGHSKYSTNSKQYISKKLVGGLNLVGVKQLPHHNGSNVLVRVQLLDWACRYRLDICTNYAKELFQMWKDKPNENPVPVDIRPVMYCAIVSSGGKPAKDFFLKLYREEPDTKLWPYIVKPLFRDALACASENETIDELLALTIQENSGIPQDDRYEILYKLTRSSEGRKKLSEFFQKNLTQVIARLGIGYIIEAQAGYWSEIEKIDELNNFINTYEPVLVDLLPSLKVSIRTIENNFNWMTKFGNDIGDWINNHESENDNDSTQDTSSSTPVPDSSTTPVPDSSTPVPDSSIPVPDSSTTPDPDSSTPVPNSSTTPDPDSSTPVPDSSTTPDPDSSTQVPDSSTTPDPDSSTTPDPDSSTTPDQDSSTLDSNSSRMKTIPVTLFRLIIVSISIKLLN